ncbi:Hpt domain-containing protein [Desulfoferrobacter suflitae]|uniref:Hpt domain-containing protein n=1 Tax=Desulfoferrobacter suflitae TaxID=2865782 RepID=UPI0021648890|nr:Hpt domain-containing protein [Desulfoferrobacter suflitae]MCK8603512.1 Hpt domain-containing protein [Desulfoferrobacter suflitae]
MRTIIPPDLPGINVESALARLRNDEELLADIIVSFRQDNASTLADIRDALGTEDYDLARRLVHTLKGVSGNIGADALFNVSVKLETALKESDESAIESSLQAVEKQMNDVFRAANLLATRRRYDAPPASETSPDGQELSRLLNNLRDMLLVNNLQALQVYSDVKKLLPGSSEESRLLGRCLKNLDFRGALEHLQALAAKHDVTL